MGTQVEYNIATGETVQTEYTPEPYVAEIVYKDITARQLRLALLSIGIQEADVDMKLVNDPAGMVEWKYASSYKKSHPLIAGLSASFGLQTEQVNSLWLWAQDL